MKSIIFFFILLNTIYGEVIDPKDYDLVVYITKGNNEPEYKIIINKHGVSEDFIIGNLSLRPRINDNYVYFEKKIIDVVRKSTIQSTSLLLRSVNGNIEYFIPLPKGSIRYKIDLINFRKYLLGDLEWNWEPILRM